jgi:S-adenosylmethionine decarboxylase
MNHTDYLACGRHVLVDIYNGDRDVLNNIERLEQSLIAAAISEGVTVLGTLRKAFEPSGITILLLLAESHVSLHTYPEEGRAFFDAFTCGMNFEPLRIFRAFAASNLWSYKIIHIERGMTCEGGKNCV